MWSQPSAPPPHLSTELCSRSSRDANVSAPRPNQSVGPFWKVLPSDFGEKSPPRSVQSSSL